MSKSGRLTTRTKKYVLKIHHSTPSHSQLGEKVMCGEIKKRKMNVKGYKKKP